MNIAPAPLHFAVTSVRMPAFLVGGRMGVNQFLESNLSHIDIPNVCGVYLLTDTVTGRTYVGSSRRTRYRISLHFHDMKRRPEQQTYKRMLATFQEHGAKAFTAQLLQQCLPEELLALEKQWIEKLQPTENLYVCTDGREVYTEATHAKKSAAAAALWRDPEYRTKAIAARIGKGGPVGFKCSPEQIENRKRAGRISNMRRNYGGNWKEEYIRRYPEHAGDVNG